jgi:hypothetical protein
MRQTQYATKPVFYKPTMIQRSVLQTRRPAVGSTLSVGTGRFVSRWSVGGVQVCRRGLAAHLSLHAYVAFVPAEAGCSATFQNWAGTNVNSLTVSGSSDESLDAACCSACEANDKCEFWVRRTTSTGPAYLFC